MLLTEATLSTACPKDTNLAEVEQVGTQRVQLSSGGHRTDPVYAGKYVHGLPFGVQSVPVLAPIDLLPGDRVRVTADVVEREVWDVTRGKKIAWENKAVQAEVSDKAAEKTSARALAEKLGL